MVRLTQEELNAINLLGIQAQNIQNQLQQVQAAQQSVIKLLETKYDATFDPASKQFIPITKAEKK